ncbi:MAG: pyridoxal-5'-phosphate-dependent protein subunit beta [Deltaproteobacteria bacterium]|nr:pyridoxal-5'-phosphate-dependent protein subunit beta [Deltaproteobacteria bacterium]
MAKLGLERDVVDRRVYDRTVKRFREAGIVLPKFAELAAPEKISRAVVDALAGTDADAPHPLNLFRVHWYNGARGAAKFQRTPAHIVLPSVLTGVDATIVVALGERFPMIRAHKVLAAYGCLAPRIVTGQFDPTAHKAIWPSTGNYCRGGVAISRIMGCRGVAVLPAGMSAERFAWLDRWVADPSDIVRTPGTESNVKEIYDKCAELDRDASNVIFNQFCEFGNYLVHYSCTGSALGAVFDAVAAKRAGVRLRAFVSATGSAGTIAAGDYLKEAHGARIVAAEALECPTLLKNGYGEHNIQGIGDKHVPYIHNVMNTDFIAAVSDRATDRLGVLFGTDAGRAYLKGRKKVPAATVDALGSLGLSGICNVVAAVKTAKYLGLGADDIVMTVATDSAEMYGSEREKAIANYFPSGFDAVAAGETFGRDLEAAATDNFVELTHVERERVFNLGYYTWVEQQGVPVAEFDARRRPQFWRGLRDLMGAWDERIEAFNRDAGVVAGAAER